MTESNAVHVEVPEGHVMVVGHDGEPIGTVPAAMVHQPIEGEGEDEARGVTDLVEQPAKVMRIGSMIRQLLEEVKSAPLDEASRARLRDIHHASIKELETGLAPELIEELERIALPFTDDATPSDGELRIAQAQLVGWLEGLFHGIQTAIYAQQMASRAQLEQMRRALPALQAAVEQGRAGVPGQPGHPGQPGQPGQANQGPAESGGMYL
ncbi:bacterial proteasome activator family protein [Nocardioides sp. 616]|uniref:bacterial proteasome activator family protein n=1 Tax=Nocardioides sp. 616 TaxID=2268090 RepID=UPI0023DCF5C1|nr:bacterial proteasome activator family protein [Nocardioides sp. 616]